MATVAAGFQSFRPELIECLRDLGTTNTREWFQAHPPGMPADHPRADWLRYSGLFADVEQPVPPQVFSAQLTQLCFDQFQRLRPLQQWLVEVLPD